jgi:hypothetical protein
MPRPVFEPSTNRTQFKMFTTRRICTVKSCCVYIVLKGTMNLCLNILPRYSDEKDLVMLILSAIRTIIHVVLVRAFAVHQYFIFSLTQETYMQITG